MRPNGPKLAALAPVLVLLFCFKLCLFFFFFFLFFFFFFFVLVFCSPLSTAHFKHYCRRPPQGGIFCGRSSLLFLLYFLWGCSVLSFGVILRSAMFRCRVFPAFLHSLIRIVARHSVAKDPKGFQADVHTNWNRREGNDQESIQLSHTSPQRHQRERNTNTK